MTAGLAMSLKLKTPVLETVWSRPIALPTTNSRTSVPVKPSAVRSNVRVIQWLLVLNISITYHSPVSYREDGKLLWWWYCIIHKLILSLLTGNKGLVVTILKGKGDRQYCRGNWLPGCYTAQCARLGLCPSVADADCYQLTELERPEQSGFTPSKLIMEHIAALRVLVERQCEFQQCMRAAHVCVYTHMHKHTHTIVRGQAKSRKNAFQFILICNWFFIWTV